MQLTHTAKKERLMKAIHAFAEARAELEMQGAQPPEERLAIEAFYQVRKMTVEKLVREL